MKGLSISSALKITKFVLVELQNLLTRHHQV